MGAQKADVARTHTHTPRVKLWRFVGHCYGAFPLCVLLLQQTGGGRCKDELVALPQAQTTDRSHNVQPVLWGRPVCAPARVGRLHMLNY